MKIQRSRPPFGGSASIAIETIENRSLSAVQLPAFPSRMFDVTSYGAAADGTTDNTGAIHRAINTAAAAGGGTVRIPAAAAPYESGPHNLASTINLQALLGRPSGPAPVVQLLRRDAERRPTVNNRISIGCKSVDLGRDLDERTERDIELA